MTPKTITVETLDKLKPVIFDLAKEATLKLQNCHYCDIRMEASEAKRVEVLNRYPKAADSNWEISFGTRVIAGSQLKAPGYAGVHLGPSDLADFGKIVRGGIQEACERAKANSTLKTHLKKMYPELTKTIYSTELALVEIYQDTVAVPFEKDPRGIPLDQIVKETVHISNDIRSQYQEEITGDEHILYTILIRKLFASSEGTLIDQTFPLTQLISFIVVVPEKGTRSAYYDCLGDLAGWEVMEGKNIFGQTGREFSMDIAKRAVNLKRAPVCPTTKKETVIIFDGHYGALNVHEIIGHPIELDRILKMETHYAGRSRFFKNFKDNQIGKQVASPHVTAFSDPTMFGYGHFKYDDEGVLGKKVIHIDKGILTSNFLNSRATAHIMKQHGYNVEPNGAVRAMDPVYVGLIRMTNTCFAPGEKNPQDIIKEVKHGFLFKWSRIPSISESRENFRISAEETWEIQNGQLTQLYRDGSIEADSEAFLKNIDAVGNDFTNYPVFNCGKGDPMQAMRVGNGSSTIRSRAKVVGGELRAA